MRSKEIMNIAMKAGEILLVSGAEIYRVEETIVRVCRSYGVECESVVLPTGIFISITRDNDESTSLARRIKERTVDLHRIELVNAFSRELQQNLLNYDEAIEKLESIGRWPRFGILMRLLAAGISAFVFTILFQGRAIEGITAFLITLIIYLIKEKIVEMGMFQFLEHFIPSMVAAVLSLVAVRLAPQLNIYQIIIGSIVVLLPGVAITNGVKDALYGDIVSSLSRIGEAGYIAIAVGTGVGFVLFLGLRWM